MRGLLVLLLIGVLAWRWRTWRESKQQDGAQPAAPKTIAVLACRQCGVHVPAADAVKGTQGAYCCVAHRTQQES